ncbi:MULTISPECIES: hypothetical protein [unclassified Lebetimonas]|nr:MULTISPECIES: hypothetical protein [unclassified Lebetimonas]
MDKPVPSWLVALTAIFLAVGSYLIYLWLKNLKENK